MLVPAQATGLPPRPPSRALVEERLSYDINFIRKRPEQSWEDALDANEEALVAAKASRELDAAMPDIMAHTADELQRLHPPFERVGDASFIELSDESSGMQVYLCVDGVGLSVPYWHDGDAARPIFGLVQEVARVVERETGLRAYDPQQEAPLLDPGWRAPVAEGEMDRITDLLHGDGGALDPVASRRPWWKFW